MATPRLELLAYPRTLTGKQVRFLRRAGKTPANIYGRDLASTAIEVETAQVRDVLRHTGPATLIRLHVAGAREPYTVLARRAQHDPVSGVLLHVDFYQVRMTERLRVDIPVRLVGTAPAVERGEGVLVQNLRTIAVEALPADLPASIEADVSGLEEVHASVRVRDLRLPDNVTMLSDPEEPVVRVTPSRAEVEPEERAPGEPKRVAPERVEEDKEEEQHTR